MYIEGRLKTRKWQDDKGADRYSTEIQCTDFTFLSTKNDNQAGNAPTSNPQQAAQKPASKPVIETPTEDADDLPF